MAGITTISSTTNGLSNLPDSILASGTGIYDYVYGGANYNNITMGFVYSIGQISVSANTLVINGVNTGDLITGFEVISQIEKSNVYDGGYNPANLSDFTSTDVNVNYNLKISGILPKTTYFIRSYIKYYGEFSVGGGLGQGPFYKYGAQLSIQSADGIPGGRGYYISDTTVGFYDPLQIRDANEGVDKVLTTNSSGLATWKPVKSLFTFGHYIGELYGGGIVVAVWKEADDEKVLISSLDDISYSEPTNFSYGAGPTGGFNNIVRPVVVQPDGKILVGGLFTSYNGVTANRIIRLNPDGSIDSTFVYGSGFGATVWNIELQSDGKILVAGNFFSYNGTTANGIIRLNTNGSIDTSFVTGTGFSGSNNVRALTIQTDGKILVGGAFTSYNGTTANKIIRLNTDGTVDFSFGTGTGFNVMSGDNNIPVVYSIVVLSDGRILVGGLFTTYNGTAVGRFCRLTSTGALTIWPGTLFGSPTFNNSTVLSIAVQSDGKILVGGNFTSYNANSVTTVANRIIRLNTDGTVDTSFVTGTGFSQSVDVSIIIVQSNGKILIGGGFTTYNGVVENRIVRLNSNGSIDTSFIPTSIGFNNSVWYITLNKGRIFVSGQFTSYNGNTANRFYIIEEKIESWSIGAGNTTSIGTSAQSKYNGYLNTLASNAQSNLLGITSGVTLLASSYRGGGYDDWYLPSYFELNQIFNQAAIVNKVLNKESLDFLDIDYWSSTEYDSTSVITSSMLNLLKGGYAVKSKSDSARVRLVRKESIYTGDGLILNLDSTNKKSFSDIEYLNIGSTTKWKDLVNGGLTSSYSFNLSSTGFEFPRYFPSENGFIRFNRGRPIFDDEFEFINNDSYVDFKAPVGNATTVTVETWVRLRSGFSGAMIFGWNTYDVYCFNGMIGYNSANSDVYGISSTQVTNLKLLGNWAHYVFEMKVGSELGAAPSFFSNNKIYINGNEQILSQQPTIVPTPGPTASNINFNSGLGRIGGWKFTNDYFINMDMSVFRVYNRALTKDEIMKNYSKEKKKYEILPVLLTNNLLFHIDFDNTSSYSGDGRTSGVVTDLSGSGRTATLNISGTTVKPVVIKTSTLYNGKEIIFSGSTALNPSLFLANSVDFLLGPLQDMTNLSISIWIKVLEYKTAEIIVRWDSTDNGVGPWEVFQSESKISFRLRSNGTTIYETRVGTKTLTLNKWTHVCATYNNFTKKMKTYIDGILDIDSFVPNTFSFPSTRAGDIFIGQYPDTVSDQRYPLNGSIVNIQIYNKELSYGEVLNNYDTDKFRFDNFSDANNFYSHEINGNPTFSISQNLTLNSGTASNDKILRMNSLGYSTLVDKSYLFTRPTNYRYIGELYGGGIIVAMWYYPKTIFNYLIMSLEDISGPVAWSNINNVPVSNATSDFDGISNTTNIISQSGHISSAAKLCDDYSGGGFTDWYLPSVFEMNQAYNAGSIVDTVLGSDLLTGSYWTSTEVSSNTVYKYTFTPAYTPPWLPGAIDERSAFGYQTVVSKSPSISSRPKVRAFRLATNAVIVDTWNPVWDDEGYTPWWQRNPDLDWQPITYDTSNFDYWRRRNLKTGTITVIFGSFTVGAGFTITGNRITIWENVLEFGICWTLGAGFTAPPIPTINDNKVVSTGSYNVFNSTITTSFSMLNYSVRVRVYATTSSGTYYGDLIMTGSNYE